MIAPALCLAVVLAADPASAPAAVSADMQIRVVYAHTKTKALDPKLKDLESSFKSLTYTAYELKAEQAMKVTVGGAPQSYATPLGRHVVVSATKSKETKKGAQKIYIELEIPELKFKTNAWISTGATLVIGGPKFEDGVLLFAVGASSVKGP